MTFVVVGIVSGAWQTDSALRATSPEPIQAPVISTVGALQGVVRDDFGAPAARVVVLASSDGNSYRATTDNDGRYRFQGVAPGRYQISAGRPGFSTFYPGTLDAERSAGVTVAPGAPIADISFALSPISKQFAEARLGAFSSGTTIGTLTLWVSVQIEGGGRLPVFVDGRFPTLRLTNIDTNVRYEMPFSNVFIRVPVNMEYGARPDDYKVSLENLPAGYAVKNIMFRADEPGFRLIDVSMQSLRISSRAIYASYAGTSDRWGAPDIPIAITLTRTTAPAPAAGLRVTGNTGGVFAMPQILRLGENEPTRPAPADSDIGIFISGKPGTLYSDGTFEFDGVDPGLHSVVLISRSQIAAAQVLVRDRNVDGISLQPVSMLPKDFSAPQRLPATINAAPVLPRSSVTLRVLDESTQQPIKSGYVTLSAVGAPSRNYVGSSLPTAQVSNLLPGQYLVMAEAPGYNTKSQPVTVASDDTKIDIAINRTPK